MLSVPAAFVFGVLGIIMDNKKWLAVVTTIIAGLLVALYIFFNVVLIFCR